jgi:putative ATPase
VAQAYAPETVAGRRYYEPSRHGAEARFADRSERIREILHKPPPDADEKPADEAGE